MRKLYAASGQPGVPDDILGLCGRLHEFWPEDVLRGPPGAVIAKRDGAICRATLDGAVWIAAITPEPAAGTRRFVRFKITATLALVGRLDGIEEQPLALGPDQGPHTFRELSYREANGVGWLAFEFLNGAMSVDQCRRLLAAYRHPLMIAGDEHRWLPAGEGGDHLDGTPDVAGHQVAGADEDVEIGRTRAM